MIRTPLDHRTSMSSIFYHRAHNVAKILLLYNFFLGGMIFCRIGAYTIDFLKFTLIYACLIALSDIPVNPR